MFVHNRNLVILVLLFCLAFFASIFLAIHQPSKEANPNLVSAFQKQAPFSILVPEKEYAVISGNYDGTAGVLTYTASGSSNAQFTVTEQTRPTEFEMSLFPGTQFLTQEGTAVIGRSTLDAGHDTGNSGILVTDKVLITVVAKNAQALSDLKNFISSLKQSTQN